MQSPVQTFPGCMLLITVTVSSRHSQKVLLSSGSYILSDSSKKYSPSLRKKNINFSLGLITYLPLILGHQPAFTNIQWNERGFWVRLTVVLDYRHKNKHLGCSLMLLIDLWCGGIIVFSWHRQVSVDRVGSMVIQMTPVKLNGNGTGNDEEAHSNEKEIGVSALNCGEAKGLEYCDLGSAQCWEPSWAGWFLIENRWLPAWNRDVLDSSGLRFYWLSVKNLERTSIQM